MREGRFVMRKMRSVAAGTALVAAAVLSILVAARAEHRAASKGVSNQVAAGQNQDARIARIENGLLPPVAIKGAPLRTKRISEEMARLKVPGVSVAFYDHGQIVWTRTYGYADVATKKRVGVDTRFQAASISKPVGALATLRLVQEEKLSLDENVNDKLRGWKVPENQFTKTEKVTLRRILSHSAGLTVHGFAGYAQGEPVPTMVQILNGEKPANSPPIRVDVVPGTIWRYSGGGYVVMQLLVTEQTGEAFPVLLHNLVLGPGGMTHSTYEQPIPPALRGAVATPYRASGEPVKGGPHTYPEMAPAGLWTTPSDLDTLAIELEKEYEGTSQKILSQAMMRQMLTRQKDDWGLGFELGPANEPLRFGHGGANEGYRSEWQNYMSLQQGVAIMTNSDSGGELADEYLRAVAREYGWPGFHPTERTLAKVDPAIYSHYVGTYALQEVGRFSVREQNGKLYVQAGPLGPEPVELLPESDTNFFVLPVYITFSFENNGKPSPTMTIRPGTETLVAKRIQ